MFWGLGFKGIFTHLAITFSIRYLLDMPRVKHIVEDPQDPSMRLLLFSEAIAQPGAIALLALPVYSITSSVIPFLAYTFYFLSDLEGVSEEKILAVKEIVPLDVVQHEVVLDYSYWPVGTW